MAGLCLVRQLYASKRCSHSLQSFSILTAFVIPFTSSSYAQSHDKIPRWRQMDLIGVIMLMGALICFILGLTQGPIDGWGSASFIAPFVLSIPLAVAFFLWGT